MRRALLIVVSLLAGCEQRRTEEARPAPSSSIAQADARRDAAEWSRRGIGRSWSTVAPTGSMLPTIDSRSLLLLEPVSAADLRVNDLALYERDDGLICHRVRAVRPDGVLFAGDNNRGADGWISPDRIRSRVAGILFTDR